MLKIRLDKRIKYQGHGDSWPDAPLNYFQKLFTKYTTPETSCPDWLQHFFPDHEGRQALIDLRKDALFFLLEAAKLQVRTTTGWHGKRRILEQRALGGRLARLRHQSGKEAQMIEVSTKLRALQGRPLATQQQVASLIEQAQYHWHTVMFTISECLQTRRRASLPFKVIRGICKWLSFPEIGIHCTVDMVRISKRHFYIQHKNGYAYRVYQPRPSRTTRSQNFDDFETAVQSNEHILVRSFKCHLCGQSMEGNEIGHHLLEVEHIPQELIGEDQGELYRADTDETLASWSGPI